MDKTNSEECIPMCPHCGCKYNTHELNTVRVEYPVETISSDGYSLELGVAIADWLTVKPVDEEDATIPRYKCKNCDCSITPGDIICWTQEIHSRIGECIDCGFRAVFSDTALSLVNNLAERLWSGEHVPIGECPKCGSLAHKIN